MEFKESFEEDKKDIDSEFRHAVKLWQDSSLQVAIDREAHNLKMFSKYSKPPSMNQYSF
jgi:hypothetical protein